MVSAPESSRQAFPLSILLCRRSQLLLANNFSFDFHRTENVHHALETFRFYGKKLIAGLWT
jgi:hypothetical protein